MKPITLIFFLIFSSALIAQADTTTNYQTDGIDSIHFSIWEVKSKETSSIGDTIESEVQKELKRVNLTPEDQAILIKTLSDLRSYDQTRALLYHFSIMFEIYRNGNVSSEIKISTLTGNIDLNSKHSNNNLRKHCGIPLNKMIVMFLLQYDCAGLIKNLNH